MPEKKSSKRKDAAKLHRMFLDLNRDYVKLGLNTMDMENCYNNLNTKGFVFPSKRKIFIIILISLISISAFAGLCQNIFNYLLGIRCLVPNNYFIWEATRPVSNCDFCKNITEPIILQNVTREEFAPYAYTSQPIVIKKAFLHWPAMKYFNFQFFKKLYAKYEGSYQSVDNECQFLHFKSDFTSIKDVFNMNIDRIKNKPGQKSWYVGWGNCHPKILRKMRQYYSKPHFLPEDCEIPAKDYVFMGYDDGATMHLDFINRLMWQAQLKGTKTWKLVATPECQQVCSQISFFVEPGDAVLLDTRIWYHGTRITMGEFSLSIQSEYG